MTNKLKEEIEQTVRQVLLGYFLMILKTGGLIFLIIILAANFFSSQSLDTLYFKIAQEDDINVVYFLRKIRGLPEFSSFLEMNKKIFGEALKTEVFAEDQKRNNQIDNLEKILNKNQNSTTLLYNLSLLYKKNGDEGKAQEYMDTAKKIDPSIR